MIYVETTIESGESVSAAVKAPAGMLAHVLVPAGVTGEAINLLVGADETNLFLLRDISGFPVRYFFKPGSAVNIGLSVAYVALQISDGYGDTALTQAGDRVFKLAFSD